MQRLSTTLFLCACVIWNYPAEWLVVDYKWDPVLVDFIRHAIWWPVSKHCSDFSLDHQMPSIILQWCSCPIHESLSHLRPPLHIILIMNRFSTATVSVSHFYCQFALLSLFWLQIWYHSRLQLLFAQSFWVSVRPISYLPVTSRGNWS